MDIRVLVAYATKYGATAEIAEKIGQELRQAGLQTDVLPADRVSDLFPYKAVVLGSAVYMGQWQKKAATFLRAKEKALVERPVWLFSSGPTGEGDPVQLMKGWRFPTALQPIADRIHARDIAVSPAAPQSARPSRWSPSGNWDSQPSPGSATPGCSPGCSSLDAIAKSVSKGFSASRR
jgi:menaquinone-dependent protoporphyrinogen oxidase